ncbi:ABC transporter permease [Sporosarcina sp. JAI121]|uniref:ABC transporter permease n=1 Tax=Sporosarcina sp. JAI121 TaxID=2723064 RepID=UPI0015CA6DD9|nr:ABC transporter permease [Sporosarcina sp. JAI121]NYF26004.1 ABC-2 type transport system permease protein [Sporosarcina sp. JAI121]
MREFMIIFKQAFMTKAKTKSFIITTSIMIAAVFLFANMEKIIDTVKSVTGGDGDTSEVMQVLDESGVLAERLKVQLESSESDIQMELSGKSEKTLTDQVKEGEIDSFLTLALDDTNTIQANYTSMSAMESALPMMLQDALQSIQTEMKAEELSLTGEQVQTLFAPIQFELQSVSASAKTEEELSQARGLVYVLMFLIYFAVIIYSSMIATEVAAEKSSRVMEILISSVSPVKHMFAKVFGIGSLGLLQMALLGLAGYIALKTTTSEMADGFFSVFGFSTMNMGTLVYALVFFLLGYFLFATLAALLGSLVSRTEDVQQIIMPMTLLIVAGFMIAATGLGNPEMAYLKYASFFPFFAPLVMFLRVGMLDLPVWEPLLSIAIMLVTIFLLGWFGARVYRGGVLMYGPSRSLKDIKKAIQLGKE